MAELRFNQAPEKEEHFEVGDDVEVLCDHEIDGDRVRDWLRGTVVQADTKMVAVQFLQNVYLTDGWMIPDKVLWCTQKSSTIRKYQAKRKRRPRTS